jgi:type II secretory pathway pseudopilin PulG
MNHRRGISMIESLVAITIVSLLVGLLLPAILYAREAARRLDCSHRIRQSTLGLIDLASSHRHLPANQPVPWTIQVVEILDPTIIPNGMSSSIDPLAFDQQPLGFQRISIFACPTARTVLVDNRHISNSGMNHRLNGTRLEQIPDGASSTILVAEIPSELASLWTWGPLAAPENIESAHGAGFHASAADGSMHLISRNVDRRLLTGWFDPSDGGLESIE